MPLKVTNLGGITQNPSTRSSGGGLPDAPSFQVWEGLDDIQTSATNPSRSISLAASTTPDEYADRIVICCWWSDESLTNAVPPTINGEVGTTVSDGNSGWAIGMTYATIPTGSSVTIVGPGSNSNQFSYVKLMTVAGTNGVWATGFSDSNFDIRPQFPPGGVEGYGLWWIFTDGDLTLTGPDVFDTVYIEDDPGIPATGFEFVVGDFSSTAGGQPLRPDGTITGTFPDEGSIAIVWNKD